MDKVRWIEIGNYMIKIKNISYFHKAVGSTGPAISVCLNDGSNIVVCYKNPDERDDAYIELRYDLMNM